MKNKDNGSSILRCRFVYSITIQQATNGRPYGIPKSYALLYGGFCEEKGTECLL